MTTYRPGPPAASSRTSRPGSPRSRPRPAAAYDTGTRLTPAEVTGHPNWTSHGSSRGSGGTRAETIDPLPVRQVRPSARAPRDPCHSANSHPRRTSGRRIRRRPAAGAPPVSRLRRSTSRAAARWGRNPVAPTDRPTARRRTRRGHRGRSWAPKAMPPGRRSGAPSAPDRAAYRSCHRARPGAAGRATVGLAARCVASSRDRQRGGRRCCDSETSEHQARGQGHREGSFTAGTGASDRGSSVGTPAVIDREGPHPCAHRPPGSVVMTYA